MNEEPTTTLQGREESQLIPLTVIRTETVLSKLPIHNLAKKGSIDISIIRKNTRGNLELKWEVTYAYKYGRPGQLAYKLDTLIVNRKIDAAGRPLPTYLSLGSLRDIARELDLGGNTQKVKRALRQNAGALISAKLSYKTVDKTERVLEADFTRYGVVFTGEKLPDGRKADAVYVTFNEPYREVLNNATVRPLDYDYLKRLPPAPQRFYEIVSYRIFAAIKHRHTEAKLPYSEYCTFSAQQRYFEYEPFRKQMYKIHRPHLQSGYLATFRYEETRDDDGKKDWLMYYEPGPKARAEYRSFAGDKQRVVDSAPALTAAGETTNAQPIRRTPTRQHRLNFKAAPLQASAPPDSELITELGQWGIGETAARNLLATLPSNQPVRDQIDYAIAQIRKGKIEAPPAFIVSMLKKNEVPPPTFETRAKRQAREDAERRRQHDRDQEDHLWDAYRDYQSKEIDRYIAEELTAEARDKLMRLELDECRRKYPNLPKQTIDDMVPRAIRQHVAQNIKFLTFEEFRAKLDRGELTPKPAGE